jgi:hypothetical protein
MVPMYYYQQLGEQVHRERIQRAQTLRPEWPAPHVRPGSSAVAWLPVRFARALRALAASFDPSRRGWISAGTHRSASAD